MPTPHPARFNGGGGLPIDRCTPFRIPSELVESTEAISIPASSTDALDTRCPGWAKMTSRKRRAVLKMPRRRFEDICAEMAHATVVVLSRGKDTGF